MRMRDSFYNLDEIEKFVMKNYEFDKQKSLTDEYIKINTILPKKVHI